MDLCHLKNAQLEKKKHQKYKGQVVLRGDIVKDDSSSYAVFAQQDSSASQVIAAKTSGNRFKVTRMRRNKQRTQYLVLLTLKLVWKMLQNCCKFQNRNVQIFEYVYHDTNGLSRGPVWKTQSFLLNESLSVNLWQDCYGKSNLRKIGWSTVGDVPNWECCSYTVMKDCAYLCMADIKLAGKKDNINPMWRVLNEEVDLGEPT